MKKIFTLSITCLALFTIANAQTFSDDFESYTVGQKLGPQSPQWTVWSGAAGENGTTDPAVANTDNHTSGGSKSIYFTSTSATGGPVDCVLPFGGTVLTTGQFTYSMWLNIPTGKDAYFNFQGVLPPYTTTTMYTLDCFMNTDGSMSIQNSGTPMLTTTHPVGAWFQLTIDANLSTNTWQLLINGTSQGTWSNTINQVGGIDIFPTDASAKFWVDDVTYNIVPYTLPALNLGVTNVSVSNGLVTQSRTTAVTVRNLGTTAITSFDLNINQNGVLNTQSVTGVNIASLAYTTINATAPATLIVGTNTFIGTISNVNGLGVDADATDDSKTFLLNPTTPATGKVVLTEEGTGTWCQWCPRGAVYMDMMSEKYDVFFAGVAVHNSSSDPMTVTAYDAGLAFTSFPNAKVDRGASMDPSGIETPFLTRVQVAPKVFIVNGANYNSSTRVLDVSVTATAQQIFSGNYTVTCVLTEDSIHGTASGYSQSNAYSGGGSGVMGGFELLSNPVPAAQMWYNHVARAISPSFTGQPYAFGYTSTTVGQTATWNFSYTLPAGWNSNKIHIVSYVNAPGGVTDNAGSATIAEAVTNGYVNGALATGVQSFDAPDALLSLYPNPATTNSSVTLNLKNESSVSVSIYEASGKLIAKKDYGKLSGSMILPIDVTTFAKGIYFVNVNIDGETSIQKLVKE